MHDMNHQATTDDSGTAANSDRNAVDTLRKTPSLETLDASVALDLGNCEVRHPNERIYLSVPFAEKDQAKVLGAKWDRQQQFWYVPPGAKSASFTKWIQDGFFRTAAGRGPELDSHAAPLGHSVPETRRYLSVPYGEREPAKAAGATWDKAAKCWYARPTADMSKLQRWLLNNVQGQSAPVMNPRDEFGEALRSLGCLVEGKHPIMDGQQHRIATEGDKKSERAGFYVGHLDGHPAGYIKNNRTGLDMKWKAKGYVLELEQKVALAAEAAEKQQARVADQKRQHEQAAMRVVLQGAELVQVVEPTPYMVAKGINPLAGALTDRDGKTTYIAAIDVNGKQWTTQYIQENGTKRFAKDSRKEGCFHVIGGLGALAAAPAIVIAEGYATAATLHTALRMPTVAAFDAGNLPAVARALRVKFPDKPIVIAGDDDREVEATQGVNPGKVKAEEAARAVRGLMLLPVFAHAQQEADRKGFTDFNDLARKSVQGEEAVVRQVGAVMDQAVRDQQESSQRRQPHLAREHK